MKYHFFDLCIQDSIGIFRINRPEVLNAFNIECWNELSLFVDELDSREDIKAVIFTGTGSKAFIAGADIAMIRDRTMVSALQGMAQKTLTRLEHCTKPTIAAVNGYAFGGGCEIAMACDIRIASDNAKFALPELSLGILPGAGGTQRLAKLIGLGRAKEMILTGRAINSQEALDIGLVTKIVPLQELMGIASDTAKTILKKGPLAVRLAKRVIESALSTDGETGMLLELLSYSVLVGSEDKTEGVNAFFEKRNPMFKGQ